MKIKNRNKKGELTTKQIVTIIILVVSFVIILFFLFKLNLGSESEKDICHNSVVLRSNSIVSSSGAVPLDCQRSYVCLTKDGSCESLLKPNAVKVKTEDEVYGALANELADCWWMYGEGQLNYVGSDLFPEMYCSLCSQIAFDDSIKEIGGSFKEGVLNKEKFYEYMSKTKMPSNDLTYLQYLYGTNDYSSFLNSDKYKIDFGVLNLDKQYYSLMAITSDISQWGWALRIGGGAALLVGGIAAVPFTFGGSAGVTWSILIGAGAAAATGAGAYFLAPVIIGDSGEEFIPPSLVETGSNEYTQLCDHLVTKS